MRTPKYPLQEGIHGSPPETARESLTMREPHFGRLQLKCDGTR